MVCHGTPGEEKLCENIARAMPSPTFDALDNVALLHEVKTLVGRCNSITTHLLAHLAEVDARRAFVEVACPSLYKYCIYELRMSEDKAQRRVQAAGAVRHFPVLLDMLTNASIHLTGILLQAPHLTADNHTALRCRPHNNLAALQDFGREFMLRKKAQAPQHGAG